MKRSCIFSVLVGVSLAGCGGGSSPTAVPTPVVVATPTPLPTPTPTPAAIACASPTPPPLYQVRVKVQLDFGFKKVLDSRPVVGPDESYCSYWGYGGDRCVARDENLPDSVTCNNFVMGVATQTSRYGPNWFWNDKPCRAIGEGADDPGCRQHPDNQFFALAFGPGTFTACGNRERDRVCGGIEIP